MSSWIGGWLFRLKNSFQSDKNITVLGELKGARFLLTAGKLTNGGGFLKINDGVPFTATMGYVLPRAGSIVGLSCNLNCITGGLGKSADIEVRINNINVYSINMDLGSGSQEYSGRDIQARGIDTFNALNKLSVHVTQNAGAVVEKILVLVELQFDT